MALIDDTAPEESSGDEHVDEDADVEPLERDDDEVCDEVAALEADLNVVQFSREVV